MNTIAIDVETTGLGHMTRTPREDAVLQVGIAWRENGKVRTWSDYCNPGKEYFSNGRADEALRINCISYETIQNAEPAKTVAKKFWNQVKEIEESLGQTGEFRAYNRAFDQGFLESRPWKIPAHKWGGCIMQAAASYLIDGDRLGLQRAMQMLEIPWPGKSAHDAASDAHAALLVHEKISGQPVRSERKISAAEKTRTGG